MSILGVLSVFCFIFPAVLFGASIRPIADDLPVNDVVINDENGVKCMSLTLSMEFDLSQGTQKGTYAVPKAVYEGKCNDYIQLSWNWPESTTTSTNTEETTEGPTTEGPTTGGPTTEGPTTEGPTTEGPTTEAPTTQGPTTEAPTTEGPTTEAPTTQGPTTEAPTTEGPTTEAPTTQGPTTEAPTTEGPTTEAPTTQGPTTEAPTTEGPTTEGPTTEAPTTEGPTTEVPTTEGPTTEGPTTEVPTTEGPTTEGPTTEGPTTEGPTTEGPTTEAPTTQGPTTEAPTTDGPTTGGPITEGPTTPEPSTVGPSAEEEAIRQKRNVDYDVEEETTTTSEMTTTDGTTVQPEATQNYIKFFFKSENGIYEISKINGSIDFGNGAIYTLDKDVHLFSTSVGQSKKCTAGTNEPLGDDLSIKISNVELSAFNSSNQAAEESCPVDEGRTPAAEGDNTVAIAVGTTVGVVAVAGVAGFIFYRHRRRNVRSQQF